MNNALTELILSKSPRNETEYDFAVKEAIQETLLIALSKTDFLPKPPFTAGLHLEYCMVCPVFPKI